MEEIITFNKQALMIFVKIIIALESVMIVIEKNDSNTRWFFDAMVIDTPFDFWDTLLFKLASTFIFEHQNKINSDRCGERWENIYLFIYFFYIKYFLNKICISIGGMSLFF